MEIILFVIIIAWIITIPIIWLIVRRFRPEWVGLGEDFNDQKIDNVKYHSCPKCNKGRMEPKFRSSFFRPAIGIPPGFIFGLGPPKEYVCLQCDLVLPGTYFGEKITRISLASRVPQKDAIQAIVIMILLMAIACLISTKFFQ